jgi:hypothetical protein
VLYVGVDIGKARNHSAIAIIEPEPVWRGVAVRWLETMPLGTPFPEVAARVERIAVRARGNCEIAIDATGLGMPVVDMLRELPGLRCEVTPVVITGAEQGSRGPGGVRRVPKRDLVGRLQVLFEKRHIRIAGGLKEGKRLVRELMDMRVEKMAAVKEQDDLVMALGLACWLEARPGIGFGEGRIL